MKDRAIEITHDFYLKLASESDCSELLTGYDFILLDEAQDTNPVVFKILLNSGKPIIAVGDIHQKIYGFRNAMDVMSKLHREHDAKLLYLTESFRFPQEIADLAYEWLKLKWDFDPDNPPIKGLGSRDPAAKSEAYITRTNAEIVKKIAIIDPNKDFYSYRTPSEIFALPMTIAKYFRNYQPPIKLPENLEKFVSKFDTIGDLARYAHDANDIEVKKSIDIVDAYTDRLTDLYNLLKSKNRRKKGLCILTAHTSKGLEFGTVTMGEDWEWRVQKGTQQEIEEYNLVYVAMTRAIHTLIPNQVVKDKLELGSDFSISKKQVSIDEIF
jgi:superfamily I DNA/RNA helicase